MERVSLEQFLSSMKIYDIPVEMIKPYENNPRYNDEAVPYVMESIDLVGFQVPIVLDRDLVVISGHTRLKAVIRLGWETVPCIYADELTEQQARAFRLIDNKVAEKSKWNDEMLPLELDALTEYGFDMTLFGFDEIRTEILEDNFDVDEELQKPVFSKPGDLWQLGRHRVICGDSTLEETYTRLLEGEKANLVLTDPPYNVDVEETAGKIMNDNMADEDFYRFLLSAFTCMYNHLADDGSIYVWHADTEGLNFRKAFKDAGFYLSGCCIWKKNSLVLGRSPYQWIHEPCLFGWKKKGKHKWYADRKQVTVWEYDKPKSSKDHPTMKPVPLMGYPIRNSTMTNGIVLDPFLGSGSTLIACEETGRICRGIELDPKFTDVIVKRYIEHSGGRTDDVQLIRDGEQLTLEDAMKDTQ